jgi:hypothetical protein
MDHASHAKDRQEPDQERSEKSIVITIESLIRQVNRELVPQFEERLLGFLATQDREWLIDQIVRLALDAHSLHEMDRRQIREAKTRERSDRIASPRDGPGSRHAGGFPGTP